jgi:hypothetical protein
MRRSFIGLLAAVAVAAISGIAQAGTFVPGDSTFTLTIGATDPVGVNAVPGTEDMVSLADYGGGGHQLDVSSSVFQATGLSLGDLASDLIGGLPDNIHLGVQVTATNLTGSFAPGFTINTTSPGRLDFGSITTNDPMGGGMPLDGQFVLSAVVTAAGFPVTTVVTTIPFNSSVVGATSGGKAVLSITQIPGVDDIVLTLHGGPFVTGPAVITNVTTPQVEIFGGPRDGMRGAVFSLEPTSGEVVVPVMTGNTPVMQHTVTVQGTNNLVSATASGTITLVSPMRIDSTQGANIIRLPGMVKTRFVFIPEPELNLLAATAIGILSLIGRSRMKKR